MQISYKKYWIFFEVISDLFCLFNLKSIFIIVIIEHQENQGSLHSYGLFNYMMNY